jgi:hypothetical protein
MHPAPIGVADRTRKKFYWRTVPGQHCLLAEGDIGAPIYWRTDPPCTPTRLVLERDTSSYFSISCNKFHIAYWRTEHFGAPCLFSSQSPINWALQTGNGNTLQKTRRLDRKVNRHRSPRSVAIFEHLPASRPLSFFIGHYL